MESEYLDHIKDLQGQLARGEMRLADVPGYQPGFGPNPGHWHQTDYQDLYQKVYGRPSGSMGIGRLREVALTEITPNEANHPMYAEDPSFFHKWSIPYDQLDVSRMPRSERRVPGAPRGGGCQGPPGRIPRSTGEPFRPDDLHVGHA